MKIFTSNIIKELDRATCEAQRISSTDLMERAAEAIACEIMQQFLPPKRIVVIAGPGNNGGDALAVARLLIEQGYTRVETYLFKVSGKLSHDCDYELKRLMELEGINFTMVEKEFVPPVLGPSDVLLDGLFGSGLRTPLQGGFVSVARLINVSKAYVISIDIPSGLFGEWNDKTITRDMVHATQTLVFQQPRLSFFFKENKPVIGKVKILDIGIDRDTVMKTPTDYIYVEARNISSMLKPRDPYGDKETYGRCTLFVGSLGMFGAATLSGKGALRAGVGVLTVHSAAYGMIPLQTSLPCALFDPDRNDRYITDMRTPHSVKAIGIGPGIGTNDETIDTLEALLKNATVPLILDADALNCISRRPALLSLLPSATIITPHPGEFDRLFGEHNSTEERLKKAIKMAGYYNIIIVLKGHHTMVIRPTGEVHINSTGNPGMATGGSGDVLTGVITAFAAQGFRPELAATIGVYIHGLAGDIAAEEKGEWGVTAEDIADNIGRAIERTMNHNE